MIKFSNVSLVYPNSAHPALHDVSFSVKPGEFAFIVGQSGSGKSSLLKLMTRELQATSGDVVISGQHLQELPKRKVPALRRDIGVIFQDFRLLENKTVHENVAFVLEILGRRKGAIRRSVPEALEMVGLEAKGSRFPHELSGGEQQRVAIARAIVKHPSLLLADEATGNLDPENTDDVVDVLERINARGTTVLMATHDHHLVDRLQRRVIEMRDGVIVRDSLGGYRDPTGPIPVRRSSTADAGPSAPSATREVSGTHAPATSSFGGSSRVDLGGGQASATSVSGSSTSTAASTSTQSVMQPPQQQSSREGARPPAKVGAEPIAAASSPEARDESFDESVPRAPRMRGALLSRRDRRAAREAQASTPPTTRDEGDVR